MIIDPLVSAALLGLVEGVTEFLPVSSTGHLIVASDLLGFSGEGAKTFEIFIQLGAILAIAWLYRARLASVTLGALTRADDRRFVINLLVAFVPVAVVGLLLHHWIKAHLFRPEVVAGALMVGGLLILLIEWWRRAHRTPDQTGVTPRTALGIGLAQILSLIPGVSRSGATILGGYALGLTRLAATEFSFFLAIPVMCAATVFDLLDSLRNLSAGDLPVFAVGFLVAFLSALVVVRSFLRYIVRHDFTAFAWYRIALGVILLWYYRAGGIRLAEPAQGLGEIHRFDQVPSTLDVLHQLAEAGAAEGTVVVAAVQTAGRGRRGRSWASPLGGLWLSLLCRPTAPVALEVLSLRVGIRVARALESLGGALVLALKWPNDLLLDGRKLGGILCEARWQGGEPSWVAIGVGLNVNNAIPPELAAGAIALEPSLPGLTPAALVGPVVRGLQGLGGAGATLTPEELADYTRRDWLRGRRLIEPAAGVAAGVREDGALLVRGALGEEFPLRSGHVVLAGP